MKSKRAVHIEPAPNYALWFLALLICAVPLTITSSLYNQSDLPKSAVLIFTGGLFMSSVFLFLLTNSSKAEDGIFFNRQLDLCVLAVLFAAILSTVFSENAYISFWGQYQRQVGLNLYIYLGFIYFFSSSVLTSRRNISVILAAVEITAALVSVYAIMQELGVDPFVIQPINVKRPVSTLGNSVFVGGFLIMVFPISVLNASDKKNALLRYLLPFLIMAGIIVSRTRSAYIAFAVEAVLFILLYRKTGLFSKGKGFGIPVNAIIIPVSVMFVIALLVLLFPENKYFTRVISIFGEGSNPRWLLWRDSFNIFLKYPAFGPGLGMFPNALEEFYSYQLRYTDTNRYFDHAHNNYLQALYTMGAAGLVAYIFFLFSQLRACLRGFLDEVNERKERLMFFSLFIIFSGYAAYGLTNFDDISILLLMFIFAGVIKALRKDNIKIEFKRSNIIPLAASAILLLIYFGYNTFISYKNVYADVHFLKGVKGFAEKNFRDCAEETNKAIYANGNCSIYRYILALNVYRYASSTSRLDEAGRKNLLEQAMEEVTRAGKNFINKNDCEALKSLILFELGRKNEATLLRDEVLNKNKINTDYRVSLAYYYFNSGDSLQAYEMIDSVLNVVPGSVNALSAAAFFSFKRGDTEKVKYYCHKIFEIDPGNKSAAELLRFVK